jgi:hypothetical protein
MKPHAVALRTLIPMGLGVAEATAWGQHSSRFAPRACIACRFGDESPKTTSNVLCPPIPSCRFFATIVGFLRYEPIASQLRFRNRHPLG